MKEQTISHNLYLHFSDSENLYKIISFILNLNCSKIYREYFSLAGGFEKRVRTRGFSDYRLTEKEGGRLLRKLLVLPLRNPVPACWDSKFSKSSFALTSHSQLPLRGFVHRQVNQVYDLANRPGRCNPTSNAYVWLDLSPRDFLPTECFLQSEIYSPKIYSHGSCNSSMSWIPIQTEKDKSQQTFIKV